MTQTLKKPRPDFIVVYGAPRTGTSLTMDIVMAAQYNSGKCYNDQPDPRRGRNEHPVFGQRPTVFYDKQLVWNQIKNESITCCKVIGYPFWIDFLAQRFNVKIVAPCRDKATRNQSAMDMLVDKAGTYTKVYLQERMLTQREAFLSNRNYPVLYVRFDYLISKEPETFAALKRFLKYDGPVENLMAPVDARRVKFNGSEKA